MCRMCVGTSLLECEMNLSNYRRLAQAVILQALLDAPRIARQRHKLLGESQFAKEWRERWCTLAGIDERALRSVALEIVENPSKVVQGLRRLKGLKRLKDKLKMLEEEVEDA